MGYYTLGELQGGFLKKLVKKLSPAAALKRAKKLTRATLDPRFVTKKFLLNKKKRVKAAFTPWRLF